MPLDNNSLLKTNLNVNLLQKNKHNNLIKNNFLKNISYSPFKKAQPNENIKICKRVYKKESPLINRALNIFNYKIKKINNPLKLLMKLSHAKTTQEVIQQIGGHHVLNQFNHNETNHMLKKFNHNETTTCQTTQITMRLQHAKNLITMRLQHAK